MSKDLLLQALRSELYCEKYDTIKWDDYRQVCAGIDDYSPLNPIMKIAQDFLSYYEKVLPYIPPLKWLRSKALEFVIAYIHEEDRQTNYVDIGPVNKSLNMLAVWIDGGGDNKNVSFLRHLPRVDDYLWVAEDGMKMQVHNMQIIITYLRISPCFLLHDYRLTAETNMTTTKCFPTLLNLPC